MTTSASVAGASGPRARSSAVRQVIGAVVRTPTGLFGACIVAAAVMVAVAAPWIAPHDPTVQQIAPRLSPPGRGTLLGADEFGRDVLSRLVFGTRISLVVGVGAVAVGAMVGTVAGLVGGYFGGIVDGLLGRVWDVLFAFPGALLGIVVVSISGANLRSVALAVAIVNVPVFARVCRSCVLAERELDYVDAARLSGSRPVRIMTVEILPNCVGPLLVQFAISVGFAVLLEAALSFLGLGTQPPTPSWGGMLNDSRRFLRAAPWYGIIPGVALSLLLVGLNFLADALGAIFDPRQQRRVRSA